MLGDLFGGRGRKKRSHSSETEDTRLRSAVWGLAAPFVLRAAEIMVAAAALAFRRPLLPAGNPRMLEWLTPKDMQSIVALLEKKFDYVLIDCPAGIEDGFKNAASAAREALVITTPEVAAVRDADRVIGLLNTRGVKPVQIVLNRVRPKMMTNQEMLSVDDITDILAQPLLGLVFEDSSDGEVLDLFLG